VSHHLRLLSYNIRHGGTGREAALAAVIRAAAPDVVLLQEATRPDVVAYLAAEAGFAHWGTTRRQSLGYLSRDEIRHAQWHRPRWSRHAFLEVLLPGDVTLFGVHLSAVHAAWTERRRVVEVRALLQGVAARTTGFHVLAGDFNTLAPGELLDTARLPARLRPFVWLSGGAIRWRTVQQVLDAGYVDGFRALPADDPGMTFPTWDPHLRLDYAFVPEAYRARLVQLRVVRDAPAAEASDHFPLLAAFEWDG
jgi:endonuclease/exonuclease/phosphatase family metal-dependent hydrolase